MTLEPKYLDLGVCDILFCAKLKTLFIDRGKCECARLYCDSDGRLIVYRDWMTAHGIGQSEDFVLLENEKDLKGLLRLYVKRDCLEKEQAKELLNECRVYFEKDNELLKKAIEEAKAKEAEWEKNHS